MFQQIPLPPRRYRIAFMIGALAGSLAAGYLWWHFGEAGPAAQNPDRGMVHGLLLLLLSFPTHFVTLGVAELFPRMEAALLMAGVPLNWGLIGVSAVAIWNRAIGKQTDPPVT
ncbi:MAG TPA: hypothetical protein VEY93_02215 [Longimicrobium sp.]|nr:hypothetical protein [Longimicrobium sp.]